MFNNVRKNILRHQKLKLTIKSNNRKFRNLPLDFEQQEQKKELHHNVIPLSHSKPFSPFCVPS